MERDDSIDAFEYLEWIGLLRICTAFEAYCKVYTADLTNERILEFLLLDQEFPHAFGYGEPAFWQRAIRPTGIEKIIRQIHHKDCRRHQQDESEDFAGGKTGICREDIDNRGGDDCIAQDFPPQPVRGLRERPLSCHCADLALLYGKAGALSPFRLVFWAFLGGPWDDRPHRPEIRSPRPGTGLGRSSTDASAAGRSDRQIRSGSAFTWSFVRPLSTDCG